MSHHLQPFNPPLGVNLAYCVPKPTTLVLKEKAFSLSGDSFHIVDENGTEVVRCRGQAFSLSSRKEFTDTAGRLLFFLRQEVFSIKTSFYGETEGGQVIFHVKSKFALGGTKMIATFTNASNSQEIELLVKGNWLERSATITMGNLVVAEISKKSLNARQLIADKQTYFVTVAPGVDLALIAAICVCLDEKHEE